MPIRSFVRPPLINKNECCCKLCFSPMILTVKILLFCKSLTLATRLFAEFGFLGEIVKIFKQTAFFCGFCSRLKLRFFLYFLNRGFLNSSNRLLIYYKERIWTFSFRLMRAMNGQLLFFNCSFLESNQKPLREKILSLLRLPISPNECLVKSWVWTNDQRIFNQLL